MKRHVLILFSLLLAFNVGGVAPHAEPHAETEDRSQDEAPAEPTALFDWDNVTTGTVVSYRAGDPADGSLHLSIMDPVRLSGLIGDTEAIPVRYTMENGPSPNFGRSDERAVFFVDSSSGQVLFGVHWCEKMPADDGEGAECYDSSDVSFGTSVSGHSWIFGADVIDHGKGNGTVTLGAPPYETDMSWSSKKGKEGTRIRFEASDERTWAEIPEIMALNRTAIVVDPTSPFPLEVTSERGASWIREKISRGDGITVPLGVGKGTGQFVRCGNCPIGSGISTSRMSEPRVTYEQALKRSKEHEQVRAWLEDDDYQLTYVIYLEMCTFKPQGFTGEFCRYYSSIWIFDVYDASKESNALFTWQYQEDYERPTEFSPEIFTHTAVYQVGPEVFPITYHAERFSEIEMMDLASIERFVHDLKVRHGIEGKIEGWAFSGERFDVSPHWAEPTGHPFVKIVWPPQRLSSSFLSVDAKSGQIVGGELNFDEFEKFFGVDLRAIFEAP